MPEPPQLDLNDLLREEEPLDKPVKGGVETVENTAFSSPTLTDLKFITDKLPNSSNIEEKLVKDIKDIFQSVVEFKGHPQLLWPFDQESALPPIPFTDLNKRNVSSYYHYEASHNQIQGKLRISIPPITNMGKLKMTGSPLLTTLAKHRAYWFITTLETTDNASPLFIYGIPTKGVEIKELTNDIAKYCNLDTTKTPFFLKVSNYTYKKVTTSVIQLQCQLSSAQHILDNIAKHLPSIQAQMTSSTKTISRIKCMVLEHRFHKCIDLEVKRQALLEQKALMDNLDKLNFMGFTNIDTPFPTVQGHKTVREILYHLKRDGRVIVHNIQIHPTIDKIAIWTTKDNDDKVYLQNILKKLFDSLEANGDLLQETGSNQRPRRPTDPALAQPETRAYFARPKETEPISQETHEHFQTLLHKLHTTNQRVTTLNMTTTEEQPFPLAEDEKNNMEDEKNDMEISSQCTSPSYRDVTAKLLAQPVDIKMLEMAYNQKSSPVDNPTKTLKTNGTATFNLDAEIQAELARRADKTEQELQSLRSIITLLTEQHEESKQRNISLSHAVQKLQAEKAQMTIEALANQSQTTDTVNNLIDAALLKLETAKSNPTNMDPIEANRLTSQHIDKVDNDINALKQFVAQSINSLHDDRDVLANKIGDINKGIDILSATVEHQNTKISENDHHITTAISSIKDDIFNRQNNFENQVGSLSRDLTLITERTMTEMAAQLQRTVHDEVVNLTTLAMKQGFSLFSTRLLDEAKSTINSLSRTASPRLRKLSIGPGSPTLLQRIRSRPPTIHPTENTDSYSGGLDLQPRLILYPEAANEITYLSPSRQTNWTQDQTSKSNIQDKEQTITVQREMPVSSERDNPEEAINSTHRLSNDSNENPK